MLLTTVPRNCEFRSYLAPSESLVLLSGIRGLLDRWALQLARLQELPQCRDRDFAGIKNKRERPTRETHILVKRKPDLGNLIPKDVRMLTSLASETPIS